MLTCMKESLGDCDILCLQEAENVEDVKEVSNILSMKKAVHSRGTAILYNSEQVDLKFGSALRRLHVQKAWCDVHRKGGKEKDDSFAVFEKFNHFANEWVEFVVSSFHLGASCVPDVEQKMQLIHHINGLKSMRYNAFICVGDTNAGGSKTFDEDFEEIRVQHRNENNEIESTWRSKCMHEKGLSKDVFRKIDVSGSYDRAYTNVTTLKTEMHECCEGTDHAIIKYYFDFHDVANPGAAMARTTGLRSEISNVSLTESTL